MDKKQLKKWLKIIAIFVAIAFAEVFIAEIIDLSGFVTENFVKPTFFIIPLCFIVLIVIFYVIYMFVEKGEALKIIAYILAGILCVYVVSGATILRRSEAININRYAKIQNLGGQIVEHCFENETVEKDSRISNPMHYSVGKMLIYESEYNFYNVVGRDDISCSSNIYCADNYILGYDRIVEKLENHIDTIAERNENDELVFEDKGSGEIDGISYIWSYGEFYITHTDTERYATDFSVMLTYEKSVYVIDVSVASNEKIHIDMENEIEKIVDIIIATNIFVDYKSKPTV